ncbi:MAG: aminotransferase class V-fold PLP-dependent enzyme [Actinomycetota bacterium]
MIDSKLAAHRQQFPALSNKAYFNYGGQGPLSQVSLEAIEQSYQYVQEKGPFSGAVSEWVMEESRATRAAIASELGVPASGIALTEDVTVGCNIALWGIDWQAGDHLLMSDCEHPGIVAAVQALQRRFGIEVSICPLKATLNAGDPVQAIAEQLRPQTRLLVISHILWNTGQVLPLGEIVKVCHSYPATKGVVRVLVDAAQSVGVLPLKLIETAVDFYAFTGHKWWCGPEGLGGLYVSAEALAELHPTFIGWRGIVTDRAGQPTGWKPGGLRYEIATSAYPLLGGLRAAIALQHQWGTVEERYQEIRRLSQFLWQGLGEIPQIHCLRESPPEAGLVAFELTNGKSHQELVKFLEQQGCMVRTILNPNCIRACVHYLTLEAEIEQLLTGIRNFV